MSNSQYQDLGIQGLLWETGRVDLLQTPGHSNEEPQPIPQGPLKQTSQNIYYLSAPTQIGSMDDSELSRPVAFMESSSTSFQNAQK